MNDCPDINPKATKASMFLWLLLGLPVVGILFALLLPIFTGRSETGGDKSGTKHTEMQVVAASQSFKVEYGYFPGNRPDGVYENPAGNARIFAALRGFDRKQNPRGVAYFEAKNARLRKEPWGVEKLKDGFDEKTGVLLDRYGHPYRIRLRPAFGQPIVSPYKDLPAGRADVIVWSLGKDGQQGSKADPQRFQGSDDVASWGG